MRKPASPLRLISLIRISTIITIGLSVTFFLLALFHSTDKTKTRSKQVRIDLVAFHPQQIENPSTSISGKSTERVGPLAPPSVQFVDELGPKTPGMEPPRLQKNSAQANDTIVKNLVGNKVCAECHPGEHALHAGSGHARTLKPAGKTAVARKLNGKITRDTENPDILWQYLVAGNRLEAQQIKDGKQTCFPLDYAVGSGEHGITFMGVSYNPRIQQFVGMEHRLSYYTSSDHMDITPGQGERDRGSKNPGFDDQGRVLDKTSLTKCLECHATITSAKKVGDFDPSTMVPNVSCERCHGPGKDHVEAARRGDPEFKLLMPLGVASATPASQIRECGTCHRRLDLLPPNMVHEDNHELARFQPLGLQVSACFNEGKSGLKCTTCHDPHGKVSNKRDGYNNACINCHTETGRSKCKVEPKGDCINCHMPKRTVSEVFKFTDHWIRSPKKTD